MSDETPEISAAAAKAVQAINLDALFADAKDTAETAKKLKEVGLGMKFRPFVDGFGGDLAWITELTFLGEGARAEDFLKIMNWKYSKEYLDDICQEAHTKLGDGWKVKRPPKGMEEYIDLKNNQRYCMCVCVLHAVPEAAQLRERRILRRRGPRRAGVS